MIRKFVPTISVHSIVSVVTLAFAVLSPANALMADEAYFQVPLRELKITSGTLPKASDDSDSYYPYNLAQQYVVPYAVLDGEGEIYLSSTQRSVYSRMANVEALHVHVSQGRDVTGTLYVPKQNRSGYEKVQFSIPAGTADSKAREAFFKTKKEHYQQLLELAPGSGASWFRYQMREAEAALAGKSLEEFDSQIRNIPANVTDETHFDRTFDVFSGGRAVSENLQLDRLLPISAAEEPTVELSSLEGISVTEMDWEPLTKNLHPETDPLASNLPSDQHALLFPDFKSMLRVMDEAAASGTPVLQFVQPRAEDARSRERYQKQLCLEVTALSRLLGDQVVAGVAFTGSDPYLRTGTDVAVLFETRNAAVLKAHIDTQHTLAVKANEGCKLVHGTVGETAYTGAVSPDRSVCSYTAEIGKTILVTNSLAQLQRIVDASSGKSPSLASLPEYRFFRDRYPRGKDESGLLIVSDQTIRRWCSAKWRIATSRRTRAAAIMAHYQARSMKDLVNGTVEPGEVNTVLRVPDLGALWRTKQGISSSTYGMLDFQTPIAELEFTKVTKAEADTYNRWREGYQRNWSQFFDPIAVSFSIRDDKLAADVTVMPLIDSTSYREFIEIVSGAELKATSGDPHSGSLLHWAMAINKKSERLKWANNLLEGSTRGSLLGWLGESISLYADEDPFWAELAAAMKQQKEDNPNRNAASDFMEANIHRLPVAFTAEVSDGLKLTLFLGAVRAFIEQTAPGMLQWTSLEHNGQPYVKIAATENGRQSFPPAGKIALHYAATPDMLVVTLNEDLLKRSLDRRAARKKTTEAGSEKPTADTPAGGEAKQSNAATDTNKQASAPPRPWLGKSLALQVDRAVIDLMEKVFGSRSYHELMQARAWSNIPILNEWHRAYPNREPVQLHQQIWSTTLVCPAGGKYVWNEEFQTMESTVYGHPGEPKFGPSLPQPLKDVRWLDFGLTFENRGLRARAEINRDAGK